MHNKLYISPTLLIDSQEYFHFLELVGNVGRICVGVASYKYYQFLAVL